jgi:hypothetical protein
VAVVVYISVKRKQSIMEKQEQTATLRFQTLTLLCAVLLAGSAALGQGTVTFAGWVGLSSTYYEELGMWFQVVIPPGTSGRDEMGITFGGGNTPRDGTEFMLWFRQHNPYDYVELHLTNGSTFGLTSAWLADPTAPSTSPVSISFVGRLSGGSTVTNSFITPGGGATTFMSYAFGSNFASGLASVEILAPRWAMDNLVFTVPEPSTLSVLGLGACVVAASRFLRRSVVKGTPSPSRPQPNRNIYPRSRGASILGGTGNEQNGDPGGTVRAV